MPLFSGSTVSWKSWTQTMTRSSAKMSSGAEKARQTMSFWHLFDKGTENLEIAKCLLWLFHFLLPQWCFHADSVCGIICKSNLNGIFLYICITKYVLGDEYRRDCREFGCITEVLVFDCNLYSEPPTKSLHVCNMSISQDGWWVNSTGFTCRVCWFCWWVAPRTILDQRRP